MIYYFTGAGNSRYVAQRIAKALGDTVAFMPDHIPATVPDNGEPVGFVMPRDHSVVFEIAPQFCISDSFVDCEGYSIFSKDSCPQ